MMPNVTRMRLMTVAKTGRLMQKSVTSTGRPYSGCEEGGGVVGRRRPGAPGRARARRRAGSWCRPRRSSRPALRPSFDLHPAGFSLTELHGALRHRLVVLDERTRTACRRRRGAPSRGRRPRLGGGTSSSTVSSMPARSRRSGFGTRAWIATARVAGSTRESMLVTLPSESLVRPRRAARLDGLPDRDARREASRNGEVDLDDAQVVQRRDDAPGAHERPGTHLTDAQHALEGSGDDAVLHPRLAACRNRALAASRSLSAVSNSCSATMFFSRRAFTRSNCRVCSSRADPGPVELGGLLGVAAARTRTSPGFTSAPSWKSTSATSSDTLDVIVTDSLAETVPMAWTRSVKCRTPTASTATGVSPAALGLRPGSDRLRKWCARTTTARNARTTMDGLQLLHGPLFQVLPRRPGALTADALGETGVHMRVGAGGRNRTGMGPRAHGILSPARLPVSPPRHGRS